MRQTERVTDFVRRNQPEVVASAVVLVGPLFDGIEMDASVLGEEGMGERTASAIEREPVAVIIGKKTDVEISLLVLGRFTKCQRCVACPVVERFLDEPSRFVPFEFR